MAIDGMGDLTRSLRRGVLLIFVLGSVGLSSELLLLGHFEEWRQQVPLLLLGFGLLLLAVRIFYRRAIILRLFRLNALVFVLAGIVGIYFHLDSNMEFGVEMVPTLSRLELLSKALSGAMPTLAPGALVQLGLVGFLYTYRHPALSREKIKES